MTRLEYRRTQLAGGREVRAFSADGLQLRSAASSDTLEVSGSPIVYDTPYSVRDSIGEFSETMKPGVVAKLLRDGIDCRFLLNHDGLPLARTTSGTMTLTDGPRALRFTARLDARQQVANDLAVAIERGDVSQMSAGFIVGEDEWDSTQTKRTIRSLRSLLDVSAVTYPASPTTSILVGAGEMRSSSYLQRLLIQSELDEIRRRRSTTDSLRRELEQQRRERRERNPR